MDVNCDSNFYNYCHEIYFVYIVFAAQRTRIARETYYLSRAHIFHFSYLAGVVTITSEVTRLVSTLSIVAALSCNPVSHIVPKASNQRKACVCVCITYQQ